MNGDERDPGRPAAVDVQKVGVVYPTASGDVHALSDVTCSIEAGEFVSIIGPSGCGKSTLLHTIGGMLPPSRGRVLRQGTAVSGPDPSAAAFVFQDYSLFPWMSVIDNAGIGLRFRGVGRQERRRIAADLLDLVGLGHTANQYPHELSGGMQQRVSVVRALAMSPDTLLFDEPFGALDEQTRRNLGNEMVRILTEQEKTVVMVTHSLDEAIFWADRIIVMAARPGRIVRELKVHHPRPRSSDFIGTQEFAELRMELFELISDGESTVADDSSRRGRRVV